MIGGEFEIDLTLRGIFTEAPDTYYYSSGRAALYQILISINDRRKKVFLPDYVCHTLIDTARKADYEYRFYQLNDRLEAESSAINKSGYERGDIIVLINYFGLQELSSTAGKIKEELDETIIIEDDVQAYFEFRERYNRFADYRYTSYRKTFAVPDGAPVYTTNSMPKVSKENTFAPFKIKAGDLKYRRDTIGDDSVYLELFRKGSDLINDNLDSQMSRESRELYAGINEKEIKSKRRANAAYLKNRLDEIGVKTILPIPECRTPLFIPIWLEDRDSVRKKMFSNQIFCPVHWPSEEKLTKKGNEMARHELSLITDQRYGIKDMESMIQILKKT